MEQSVISLRSNTASPDQIKTQERLAIFLACIAGYIDAVGIIKWKTYVSFMSGNTTQLGTAIFADKSAVIFTSVTVIVCFLLGIYTGTCLFIWKKINAQTLPMQIVSGILILYTIVSCAFEIPAIPSVAVIGFSMGIMNTVVTAVGSQKVNTDFVTGTLNSLAVNTARWSMNKDTIERKEYKSNIIHLLLVWIGFLSGATIAPHVLQVLGVWILTVPIILLLSCSLLMNNLNFNHQKSNR